MSDDRQSREQFLETLRKTAIGLGCYGDTNKSNLSQASSNAHLSLEQRLATAALLGSKEEIIRLLESGADLSYSLPSGQTLFDHLCTHRPKLKQVFESFQPATSKQKPKR